MIKKGAGFNRLKGAAAIGAMGIAGLMGIGTARATSVPKTLAESVGLRGTGWRANSWPTSYGNSGYLDIYKYSNQLLTFGSDVRPFGVQLESTNGRVYSSTSTQSAYGIKNNELKTYEVYFSKLGYYTSYSSTYTYTHEKILEAGMLLAVDGVWFTNPSATVDLQDNTITTGFQTLSGIETNIEYKFFGNNLPSFETTSDRGAVRGLYNFHNPTGGAINIDVLIAGNLDVAGSTVIYNTESGDTIVDNNDRWIEAGKNINQDGEPYVLLSRYGDNPDVIPLNAISLGTAVNGSDGSQYGFRYDLSIPAGETVSLLHFAEFMPDYSYFQVQDEVAVYSGIASLFEADLLEDLTLDKILQIKNYRGTDIDSDGYHLADNCPLSFNPDQADFDGDGVGDVCDADADGDGLVNNVDKCPLDSLGWTDTDGDGLCNESTDTNDDNDAYEDVDDNCPLTPNPWQLDAELDGIGDLCDPDDDNDGVNDISDSCPFDELVSVGDADTDGDGLCNDGLDLDDDGDGYLDVNDPFPLDVNQPGYVSYRIIKGNVQNFALGSGVAGLGDIDVDGYADYITLSSSRNGEVPGEVGVYSGYAGNLLYLYAGKIDGDYRGGSVAGGGDINADGYSDFIVGAPEFDISGVQNVGTVTVYSGSDGSVLYQKIGMASWDHLGSSVSVVGDLDGDGYDDYLYGTPYDSTNDANSGRADVVSGFNHIPIYSLLGESYLERMGEVTSGAGDINGDGYTDFIVASPNANASNNGKVNVYSGVTGELLYEYTGGYNNKLGSALGSAGDVNADGYNDFIISAPGFYDLGARGAVFVRSGMDGSVIHTLLGVTNGFGASVVGNVDVNRDGYSDVLVGSPSNDGNGSDAGLVKVFSGFDGSVLATIGGAGSNRRFGQSVSVAGDVNGDGYEDILIGSNGFNGEYSSGGSVHIVSGDFWFQQFVDTDGDSQVNSLDADDDGDGVEDALDACPLDALDTLVDTDGDGLCDGGADVDDDNDKFDDGVDNCPLVFNPLQEDGDVDTIGDVCDSDLDNDGVENLVDGCPLDPLGWTDTDSDGLCDESTDYDDDNDGILDENDPAPEDMSQPGWQPMYNLRGDTAYLTSGITVSAAGDVNNDGYDDVVLGAYRELNQTGSAYVYSGVDGQLLHKFIGDESLAQFGKSVDGAGDVNGDGYDDIIVGVPDGFGNALRSGYVRIFSGLNGQMLHEINGDNQDDRFGGSVSSAGDVDGDGFDDVIVGAWLADPGGSQSGLAKVFSGLDASLLYTFNGDRSNDQFGISVDGAGDVNGDGFNDVLVGAPQYNLTNNSRTGLVRVFSGIDGSLIYQFSGENSSLMGGAVSAAGDVNNDGYSDFIVGMVGYVPAGGMASVYSGVDGSVLFALSGGEQYGASVSGVGDVNNDGCDDFMVGEDRYDHSGVNEGAAYVYSGCTGNVIYSFVGSSDSEHLGIVVSGVGDVSGDGYYDVSVVVGQAGYRAYVYSGDLFLQQYTDTDNDGQVNTLDVDDDNDGWSDSYEIGTSLTSPFLSDTDEDGVSDPEDVFPLDGAESLDSDNDGSGNNADTDDDNDGMPDTFEYLYSGLDALINDASGDLDNDGFSNLKEYLNGTNPEVEDSKMIADTDGDRDSDIIWRNRSTGVMTLWEIENKTKISNSDLGGLGSGYELKDTFDTDHDGDSDLILFNESLGQAISWEMENNAKVSGSFLAGFLGYTIRGLGDLDADGDGDLVWQEVATGKVIVWIMEGGAKQSGAFLGGLGAGSVVEAIGDFDNDGDADLLWSIPTATALVRWDMENGNKLSGASIGGFVGYSIAEVGDFNKDDTDDILWQPDGGGSSIIWLMQNGDKQSGLALGQVAGYTIATVGDYDGDGDDDILWSNTVGHTKIWELENGALVQGSDLDTMDADSDIRP